MPQFHRRPLIRAVAAPVFLAWFESADAKLNLRGPAPSMASSATRMGSVPSISGYFDGDIASLNHNSYDLGANPQIRSGLGAYNDYGGSYPGDDLSIRPPPLEKDYNPHLFDPASCQPGHENREGKCMKVQTVYEKILLGERGVSFDSLQGTNAGPYGNGGMEYAWTPYGPLPRVFGMAAGIDQMRLGVEGPQAATHIYRVLAQRLEAGDETEPKRYHALFHGFTEVGAAPEVVPEPERGFLAPIEPEPFKGVWGLVEWDGPQKRYLIASFPISSESEAIRYLLLSQRGDQIPSSISETVETSDASTSALNGSRPTISTVLLRRTDYPGTGKPSSDATAAFLFGWSQELMGMKTKPADITVDGFEIFDVPSEIAMGRRKQAEL